MIRYYSDDDSKKSKKDRAGAVTGAASTAGGGILIVKTVKKGKSKEPAKKVVEVVEKVAEKEKQAPKIVEEVVEKIVEAPKTGKGAAMSEMRRAGERVISGGGQGFWSGGAVSSRTYGKFKPVRLLRTIHSEIENNNKNMEIRRKLFSLLEDENGEEKYYSTTEFRLYNESYEEGEKLFSTGDEELDDILEEVYYSGISDGYDYAYEERDFAKSEEKEDKGGSGAGIAATGGLTAGGVLLHGERKGNRVINQAIEEGGAIRKGASAKGRRLIKEAKAKRQQLHRAGYNEYARNVEEGLANYRSRIQKFENAEQTNKRTGSFIGDLVQKLGRKKREDKAYEEAVELSRKSQNIGLNRAKELEAQGDKLLQEAKEKAIQGAKEAKLKETALISKGKAKAKQIGKRSKLAAGAILTTAGAAAIGKAVKNSKKKKSED